MAWLAHPSLLQWAQTGLPAGSGLIATRLIATTHKPAEDLDRHLAAMAILAG